MSSVHPILSADNTASDTNAPDVGDRLKITEIFYSLQGEARTIGWPTTFIRLTGCPLRCRYCDTAYAFTGGEWMSVDQILERAAQHKTRFITVTGGEPLAQKRCILLLSKLCDAGYTVSLETSGAIDISQVDPRVSRVVDIKTPASDEQDKNHWPNLGFLTSHDQVKFVITDRNDFDWSTSVVQQYNLSNTCEVLFSPVYEQLPPAQLADWIIDAQLSVRFQVQLHKLLWNDEPGR